MTKYTVLLKEITYYRIDVEADSEAGAINEAEEAFVHGSGEDPSIRTTVGERTVAGVEKLP